MKQKFATIVLLSAAAIAAFKAPRLWATTEKAYWIEKDPAEKKLLQAKADEINEITVKLVKDLSPAVVTVLSTTTIKTAPMMGNDDIFDFFFGMPGSPMQGPRQRQQRSQKAQGLGSGFVISSDGIIVTNSHVVRLEGEKLADSVRIKFKNDSSKSEGEEAQVIGIDSVVDTAVLRLKNKPSRVLAVAPLGDSSQLKVGEAVMAIGNPHGLSNTVTKGIVSAMGRDVIPEISADFIQTDASINQGNSGGPLINLVGEVVGINTAIDPNGHGLGFAIPINTAKRAVKDILEKGKSTHGYAGVSLYPNFDADTAKSLGLKSADGALIEDVVAGGPADKAGMKAYDVVTKIGDRTVSTNTDFQKAVRENEPGKSVKVEYLREGKTQTTAMLLGDLEKGMKDAGNFTGKGRGRGHGENGPAIGKSGLVLENLTPELRLQWRLPQNIQGVVVAEVVGDSPADSAGLARGDIITEIQREKVRTVKDASKYLSKSGSYLVKVLRGQTVALFTLKI